MLKCNLSSCVHSCAKQFQQVAIIFFKINVWQLKFRKHTLHFSCSILRIELIAAEKSVILAWLRELELNQIYI